MATTFVGPEATSLLAANAVFNGATRAIGDPLGSLGQASRMRALAYSDVAGVLNIQQSRDGSVWRTAYTVAVPAGVATPLEALIIRPYVRASYTNGAAAQTVFELDLAAVPI